MIGRGGLGQTAAATAASVPWYCGSAFTQILPATWTPSCYPAPPAPVPPPYASTPDAAIAAGSAATKAQTQDFFTQLAGELPDSVGQLFADPNDPSNTDPSLNPAITFTGLLLIGGLALLALTLTGGHR